jgi:hypothetical protein
VELVNITLIEEEVTASLPAAETIQAKLVDEHVDVALAPAETIDVELIEEQIVIEPMIGQVAYRSPPIINYYLEGGSDIAGSLVQPWVTVAAEENVFVVLDALESWAYIIDCNAIGPENKVIKLRFDNLPANCVASFRVLLINVNQFGMACAWMRADGELLGTWKALHKGVLNEYEFRSWDGGLTMLGLPIGNYTT